jgi:tocopherol O-methyltransferase
MSAVSIDSIRAHYDRLSIFYRWFWGEHIHHGFWQDGESPPEAQVRLIEQLARQAAIPRGAKVLDIGCGFGGSSIWLARQFDCSVRGITISPVQQRIATKRARAAGLSDRVRFEVLDANEMEFASASFDVIWVIECSEHLRDKARFVAECARILRPHGVLALCSWLAVEPLKSTPRTEVLERVCRGMLCPSLGSFNDYVGWMEESGFEQIRGTDITRQVEKTWEICETFLRRPFVRALLPMTRPDTRQFAAAFRAIRHAYTEGVMAYGMFSARKP